MAVSPIDVAQSAVRRKNFQGRTDKYMPYRAGFPGEGGPAKVVEAVREELGFLKVVADSGVYNEFYRLDALQRIARYKRFTRFYEGNHWGDNAYDDGEKKPVFNFCQTIVDKSADFFATKGFVTGSKSGNEALAKAVDTLWEKNGKLMLLRRFVVTASILGDTFGYVTLETKDAKGVELPKDKWRIRIYQIDPFFVFPAFDEANPKELKACIIQMPIGCDDKGAVNYRTIFITPEYFQEVINDTAGEKIPNPFGMVNVVHFTNYDDPLKVWGQSDLDTISSLNEEYNITLNSIRKIIKYHAEPTTIIYGARASKLEKGAKKVWSGLPVDGRVENLEFDGNLEATYKYLDIIEKQIHKLAGIPSVLFQTDQAVSHTSAIAMKMLYQPMLEKNERKQVSFSSSFTRMNKLLFRGMEILGVSVSDLADTAETLHEDIIPEFEDPIPYDQMGELDADQKRFNLGVVSKASLVRKYNPAGDISKISSEIIADQVADILVTREKSVAMNGGQPNVAAPFVSSLGMSDEIKNISEKVSAEIPEPPPAPEPAPSPAPAASQTSSN